MKAIIGLGWPSKGQIKIMINYDGGASRIKIMMNYDRSGLEGQIKIMINYDGGPDQKL